ncbi:hypothetical protein TYRP_017128 [Tyrophagus putrescentiae]|nr:hypothetical protein TYRP_017128 [Tyrophagus putrescentiae]
MKTSVCGGGGGGVGNGTQLDKKGIQKEHLPRTKIVVIGRASKRYTGGQLLTQTKIAGHFPIRSSPLLLIFLSHHLYLCTHHHSSSSYHRVGLFRQPPTKPSSPYINASK